MIRSLRDAVQRLARVDERSYAMTKSGSDVTLDADKFPENERETLSYQNNTM